MEKKTNITRILADSPPVVEWRNWHYKNTTLLIISLFVFYYLAQEPSVRNFMEQIGALGYLGAFLMGILFVSIFTVAPSAVILFDIAQNLDPVMVAVIAGFGAVVGDYIIFRYLKDRVFSELVPVVQKNGGSFIKKIFLSPFFIWLTPLIGALIVASPLPDEVGIGMLGLSKIKSWQFVLVTFVLNSIGIFLIVSLSRIIHF